MASLTDDQASYFTAANVGMLGTTRADGSAHVSPVWVDYDGGRVVLNTVEGGPSGSTSSGIPAARSR